MLLFPFLLKRQHELKYRSPIVFALLRHPMQSDFLLFAAR